MKSGIKYSLENPFYIYFKKHYCPSCKEKLRVRYKSEIIDSRSPQAKKYDFSLGDTFLSGEVEFKTPYFYCSACGVDISVYNMKEYEKTKRFK